MALAKWFGQPSSSSGSSAACPPSTEPAKAVAINKAELKQFGLENFGNTCYVNSVLQALYFCNPFRELIIQVHDKSNPPVPPSAYSSSSPLPSSIPTNPRAKSQRKPSSAEVPRENDGAVSNGSSPPTGPPIPPSPPTMFSALRSLFVHISDNPLKKGVVSPKAFIEKLKKENELFRSTMHQDAHEFLIYLLNKIAEDLEEEARIVRSGSSSGEDLSNSVTSSGAPTLRTTSSRTNSTMRSTIVHDLFEGVLTSETRCLTCETVSSRDEAFLDLSIDIEQNSSVTACLRQFSASEMLCQKNKFFCDSCCGLQEAEKRMKIKRLPNVLALHLKRFKYQEDVGKYIKLAYRVAFPLELRLFNTADDAIDPDRLYELFAIVVHIGNGPHHGHYIAIVKSSDTWLVFDDDSVDTIKESDISKYFGDSNSGAAYVLYYQALDIDLPALGLKVDEPVAAAESVARASPTQAPLLPPGLTHEGDSDASEFAPTTPGSPAMPSIPTVLPGSPPTLTVSIPPSETSPSMPIPASTPTVAPPPAKSNGFFNNLRHSPSKPSFVSAADRSSAYDTCSPPVPPLPPSIIPPPQIAPELSEASTSTTSPMLNGKTKSPMEKASGWFSRKRSARPEKEKPYHTNRPATVHGTPDHHDGGSFASSSSSSRVPIIPDASPNLHPPEVPTDAPTLLPAFSAPLKSPSQDSARMSNYTVPPQYQNGSAIPHPTSPTSASHNHHNFHLPSHKKSQPEMATNRTSPTKSKTLPTPRPPKRPSTAGAATSPTRGAFTRIDESPPLPSLPSELRSPIPRPRTANYDPSVPKEEWDQRRFSTQVPPSTPLKRATRKLSFTSGMFSFVRKDRDKHRSEEPPSSFSPAVGGPSMVPGVHLGDRL